MEEIKVEHYGLKLRGLREKKGLSQTECAKLLDLPQSTLSNIERNHSPQIDVIVSYVKKVAPDIRLYEFFMDDGDIKEITGVDPSWITIAQMVEQMPEEIKTKIMANILQIVDMMLNAVVNVREKLERNLDERHSR